MRQILTGITVGLCTLGIVSCSNTDFWHSNSTASTSTTKSVTNKPAKVTAKATDKSTTSQTTTTTSDNSSTTTTTDTTSGGDRTQFNSQRISSNFSNNMDPTDKSQLREAFENNAVGQTSNWKNDKTGVAYQVTPTKNITYKGNEYCREYTFNDSKGEQKQGVACRSKGAVWAPAS